MSGERAGTGHDRTRQALRRMAAEDPELAVRLIMQALPVAAEGVRGPLHYELAVEGVGRYRISVADGSAGVERMPDGEPKASAPASAGGRASSPGDGGIDFRLATDAETLAEMATGASPVGLMLGGRLRIRGKRRRALRLRAMGATGLTLAEVAARGGSVEPDAAYRALQYLIDPEWTRGHRFVVAYEVASAGDGAQPPGRWFVQVSDGDPVRVTTEPPDAPVATTVRVGLDAFRRLMAREITPSYGVQNQLIRLDGEVYPVTILGRWIERAQGRDEEELEREARQRELQARRVGAWGSSPNGSAPGQGDPGHESEGGRRAGAALLDYGQLYALWERQNWKAHEIDLSVDREHHVAHPRETQSHLAWSLGAFYAGEERVTADLAPFLTAAPSGEVEVFLATQLVDEARHAAFFDRFGAEVMALEPDDLRGRLAEIEGRMLPAWHEVFDGGLRDVADRIRARPDDLELFVEGIATYHMVIEGVLAMTGQHFILKYMQDHALYPGFVRGFSLVEQDEHRHIAFGVRFLKDMVERDSHFGDIVERRVRELVPRAVLVFVPPHANDPADFVDYAFHSSEIYGYAYRALRRRMAVIGLETPPAEDLMPGPIAPPDAMGGVKAASGNDGAQDAPSEASPAAAPAS